MSATRMAKCHPDQPAARGARCLACLKAYITAQKQALLARKASEAGRSYLPRKTVGEVRYRECACGKPTGGRRDCGAAECRPAPRQRVAPTRCVHCDGPKPPGAGGRATCSDACAKARMQVLAEAASHVGCRSAAARARRRADRRVKYRRPDKAEVIARLLVEQCGRCAVCGEYGGARGLVLDHDHHTGDPRAMLCTRCNAALGMMRESPERIRGLHLYAIRCAQAGIRGATPRAEGAAS